jgi:hypothetical protein
MKCIFSHQITEILRTSTVHTKSFPNQTNTNSRRILHCILFVLWLFFVFSSQKMSFDLKLTLNCQFYCHSGENWIRTLVKCGDRLWIVVWSETYSFCSFARSARFVPRLCVHNVVTNRRRIATKRCILCLVVFKRRSFDWLKLIFSVFPTQLLRCFIFNS